jgi:membrane protein DedA with SNARE-associated domain
MQPPTEGALAVLIEYRYWILIPLTMVQGPVVMTASGFLLRLGYFTFWPLYLVLMVGDLLADITWYVVGYHGGHPFVRKYGRFFSLTEGLYQKIASGFHRHQNKILFLSKITMGLGFAIVVLLTAGIVRVPFRKYILFNAFGQIVWTVLLIAVGYFFGTFYLVVNEAFRFALLIAGAAIFIGALYGVNRYLRQKDLQNQP